MDRNVATFSPFTATDGERLALPHREDRLGRGPQGRLSPGRPRGGVFRMAHRARAEVPRSRPADHRRGHGTPSARRRDPGPVRPDPARPDRREPVGTEARPAGRRPGVREGPDRDRERDGAAGGRNRDAEAASIDTPTARTGSISTSGPFPSPAWTRPGDLRSRGLSRGSVKGSGTVGQAEPRRVGARRRRGVERESARAPGHRARAPGDGRPRRLHVSGARSRSGRDHAPTRRDGRAMARPQSRCPLWRRSRRCCGLPEDARLDGRLSAEASLSAGKDVNALRGEGTVSAARVTAYGRTLELRAPARAQGGKRKGLSRTADARGSAARGSARRRRRRRSRSRAASG